MRVLENSITVLLVQCEVPPRRTFPLSGTLPQTCPAVATAKQICVNVVCHAFPARLVAQHIVEFTCSDSSDPPSHTAYFCRLPAILTTFTSSLGGSFVCSQQHQPTAAAFMCVVRARHIPRHTHTPQGSTRTNLAAQGLGKALCVGSQPLVDAPLNVTLQPTGQFPEQ